MKKKDIRSYIIVSLIIYAVISCSASVFLYPYIKTDLTKIQQAEESEGYEAFIRDQTEEDREVYKEEAYTYNTALAEERKFFSYKGAEATDDAYESALDGPDGQMCVLDIPSVGIQLPVYHGTAKETLDAGAGHMYGTSLPIGGESSHCVITGHTGLATADMMTDLRNVKEGDAVNITICDEIHHYTVDRILTVLPEEADDYLQISDGKDYITMYTCTPYGINTHRLLVRAVRTLPDDTVEFKTPFITKARLILLLRIIGMCLVPVLIPCLGVILTLKRTGKMAEDS